MKQTAVEWLEEILKVILYNLDYDELERIQKVFDEAKEMEKVQKLTQELFLGKVSQIIGFSETIELLKESKETFNL